MSPALSPPAPSPARSRCALCLSAGAGSPRAGSAIQSQLAPLSLLWHCLPVPIQCRPRHLPKSCPDFVPGRGDDQTGTLWPTRLWTTLGALVSELS